MSCNASEEGECRVRVVAAALTAGSTHAELLRAEPWQEAAIVGIHIEGPARLCSGVLIGQHTVLTAGHCFTNGTSESILVVFDGRGSNDSVYVDARVTAIHEVEDVALLELAAEPPHWARPLAVATRAPAGATTGAVVQLAGFGLDRSGQAGHLQFSVEEVASVGSEEIEVSAAGLGGACSGDSGGPMLVRGDSGHVEVLGVLKSGTANCYGRDRYVRVDVLMGEWEEIRQRVYEDQTVPYSLGYAALGIEGRCFGNNAVWSDRGALGIAHCSGGRKCGWDETVRRYGCIVPEEDFCDGIDDIGRCEAGEAVRCDRGRIVRNPCDECGFVCGRSPRTGAPICISKGSDGGVVSDGGE